MNSILKITLVGFAALALNTATAQNALQKKDIKKAEATTSVKQGTVITQTAERTEQSNSTMVQTHPAQVKQLEATTPKTPAQMANRPLQKKTAVQRETKNAK
ncbi:MAG: hypothetical protein POELPBGB_03864 [Bacteroidia bacterium]|nr:hypothetical protein [Bacteroidia bacterium]